MKYLLPLTLFAVCLVVAFLFYRNAASGNLTENENLLFQIFSLSAGIGASYLFGRISAKDAALEIVKPHSKAAFRRLLSLYESLGRLVHVLNESKNGDRESSSSTLGIVEAIVIEQLSQADDAMEDWRDIVPEEVDQLLTRSKTKES